MTFEFKAWPKTPRLNRDIVITEKIDGTNACVIVSEDGSQVGAQSRNRVITPESDNAGFARWVYANAGALADTLGPGYHYGEWWGSGIQRGYGLTNGDKRFSLFNTHRWDGDNTSSVGGLGVVPILYQGPFSEAKIKYWVEYLRRWGSVAVDGIQSDYAPLGPPAEGVVIYHTASKQVYKVLLENDDLPKGLTG